MMLGWLAGGALIGALNALMLSASVGRLEADAPAHNPGRIVASMTVRWIVVAALLAAAFRDGIGAGLLALAGFWIARWAAILWWNYKG
ncbi:MAG: hypothetical protein JXA21_20150 [Anaerolineae bacterium]|nr:hypothetical protein [Anaerolineae bacterium]